ncbi:dormancy-associated protein-like protein 3-like isoform X2 [Gossypium australe]|uniref:Dormancy-associated protein-like protein 3-like isoform X2 n=1 Tax=Gossypium australe TaxID=47621 RepID=A0A5B6VS68_9ROSI|nr:dormancy-associated protein-like protein 3-like isoform X2 [Gossypium australe]KAA3472260.1 dormancy-associated protein-like protein 3-like isoform X2 [Gossypium australe]KAA3472263.1 dormancy-associated protein-like protein 3-like isoform X2 [Gossypium australe]
MGFAGRNDSSGIYVRFQSCVFVSSLRVEPKKVHGVWAVVPRSTKEMFHHFGLSVVRLHAPKRSRRVRTLPLSSKESYQFRRRSISDAYEKAGEVGARSPHPP